MNLIILMNHDAYSSSNTLNFSFPNTFVNKSTYEVHLHLLFFQESPYEIWFRCAWTYYET